jgi:hypothetical protein
LGSDAFPGQASRSPEGVLQVLRVPRAAGHTLRRVPLISSRTASLRPLPSCHCCTFSLPGPARPEPSVASLPQPRLLARCRCTAVGRNPCQRGTTLRVETVWAAVRSFGPKPSGSRCIPSGRSRRGCCASLRAGAVGVACSPAGRGQRGCALHAGRSQRGHGASRGPRPSRRGRHLRGPRPPSMRLTPLRGGGWNGPDCPATEAAVRPPKGPTHLTDRGRCGVHRSPRWAAVSKSRCAALVMLRSAEADPHVTNRALRAGRRADLLRPRLAPSRGPKAMVRRSPGTTLQSVQSLVSRADRGRATRLRYRTRACGAFGGARCQTPPSTPLRWNS